MSEAAADFASFVAKLEQAYPEWRVARPLLARRPAALAAECLMHELSQALLHIPEATVAAAKLAWWSEEIARWTAGEARHPLTRQIPSRPLAGNPLLLLAAAAAPLREAPPAADFATQLSRLDALFGHLATLRAGLVGGDVAVAAMQARLWTLGHLLRQLARLPVADSQDGDAVPMQLLARHQLSRAQLGEESPAREALAREQLAALHAALQETGVAPVDAAWMAGLRRRCDLWRSRPLAAGPVFPQLWARLDRAPLRTAWWAWRAARRHG
jgi:15-cis-phytoene synthase